MTVEVTIADVKEKVELLLEGLGNDLNQATRLKEMSEKNNNYHFVCLMKGRLEVIDIVTERVQEISEMIEGVKDALDSECEPTSEPVITEDMLQMAIEIASERGRFYCSITKDAKRCEGYGLHTPAGRDCNRCIADYVKGGE